MNPAQDVPGSAQAAWKEQTGGLRLEGESPLLRCQKSFGFLTLKFCFAKLHTGFGDSNRNAPVKNSKA
jgi:hypothetical protein